MIPLKQPLQSVTLQGITPLSDEITQVVAEEANVLEVIYKTKDGKVIKVYRNSKYKIKG